VANKKTDIYIIGTFNKLKETVLEDTSKPGETVVREVTEVKKKNRSFMLPETTIKKLNLKLENDCIKFLG
jgi:hypothetical protein